MNALVSVEKLRKTYKTFKRGEKFSEAVISLFKRDYTSFDALKGISFEIKPGEIVGLIGPNGAGKSTCIKALCGILHPTSGKVKVMDFDPYNEREKYVKNIGAVFGTKCPLWWDNPPIDTFHLMKALYDIPDKIFKKRLKYLLNRLNVEGVYKTPARSLSLGERMKSSVIAALLHNPKLVFLDEPTIGMDVVAKDIFRKIIKDVNKKEKTTFIITTHDMTDVEKLCERVIIINNGEIIYDGSFSKLKKKYIRHKVIDVKFRDKVKLKVPKGCKKIYNSPYEIKIEVSLNKNKVDKIVTFLLDNYPVADITISDPEIDEIIAEIYSS